MLDFDFRSKGTTPGELPLNTILSNTVLITTPSTLATARRNFKWLGSPGDTLVSVKEAASVLEEVAGVLEFTDEVFESKIYKMLNQNSLHVLSAPEKYTMAFHHIDLITLVNSTWTSWSNSGGCSTLRRHGKGPGEHGH